MLRHARSFSVLLMVSAALALPAWATKRLSVEQLQQTLEADRAAHRSDQATAQQLASVELTARLSRSLLQQLQAENPGTRTGLALRILADASAFLPPPPSEIPAKPAPDIATQRVILNQTVSYVARSLPALPDFLATRITEHYDNSPVSNNLNDWVAPGGFRYLSKSRRYVTFRDGRETDDQQLQQASLKGGKKAKFANPPLPGESDLTSWGEFGPVLGVTLLDASKGKLSWARWELDDGKPAAVFQFTVDQPSSHYAVQTMKHQDSEAIGGSYGGRGEGPTSSQTKLGDARKDVSTAAYHGTIAVDPETGTVLRIVILADLGPTSELQNVNMMVEYGPVKIDDKDYICPVHSVTESLVHVQIRLNVLSALSDYPELRLNDVQFTDYHRFGSEAKLVIPHSAAEPNEASQAAPVEPAADSPEPSPIAQPASAATSGGAEATVSSSPAPVASVAEVVPPPAKVVPSDADEEILVRSVNGLPGLDPAPGAPGDSATASTFTLKVSSQLVDINLIAYDKHDKPITDLKPEEIEIYDNGKRQQLKNFQHPNPALSPAQTPPAISGVVSNTDEAVRGQAVPDLLILLIDESHLAFLDLGRARGEVQKFLKSAAPDARIALYSIGEQGSHIIQDATQDRALVAARLASWRPAASATSRAQDLDQRNRQQIDTVHNAEDLNSVNGNVMQSPDYIQTADPALRQMGDNPLRSALESMIALARHFASSPGHKSMVWITGDSALIDREDKAVTMEKGDHTPNSALTHTREVMNEARIALYVVDATSVTPSGGGAVDASLYNPAVGLDPTAAANSKPGGAGGPHGAAIGSARTLTDLQENTRAIQPAVRELAEATGGLAINKGSDLERTLSGIERHASALYELGFYPDSPADNKFHTLQLKVPKRRDVKLRYRTGYLYAEESSSTKQRFQDAVWAPQDLNGIQLTAEAIPAAESPTGKNTVRLRIAVTGLSLQKKEDRWDDDLYIFLAQRDDATQKAELSGDTLRLQLTQRSYDSGMPAGIPYQHEVAMPDGKNAKLGSLRILVVDGNSGKMGTVTLPISAFQN